VEAARAAVAAVAEAMGLESPEAVAAGIIDIVNENMLGGLRLVSVQQGFDPRDFALVAFGGAGPLHSQRAGEADRCMTGA
jgi:N-methylhydantoinase A